MSLKSPSCLTWCRRTIPMRPFPWEPSDWNNVRRRNEKWHTNREFLPHHLQRVSSNHKYSQSHLWFPLVEPVPNSTNCNLSECSHDLGMQNGSDPSGRASLDEWTRFWRRRFSHCSHIYCTGVAGALLLFGTTWVLIESVVSKSLSHSARFVGVSVRISSPWP